MQNTSKISLFARLATLFAALFFVFLAGTGLLLNHGDLAGLDKTKVNASWLMHWYGLNAQAPEQGFRNSGTLSAFSDTAWVVGGNKVSPGHGDPLGVVLLDENYWVATPATMSLYHRDGQLVDRIEMSALPALPIRRIGVREDKAVLDTAHGMYASSDGLNWSATQTDRGIVWSHAEPLRQADKVSLGAAFAPALPVLRIVSDLHSGHIWGRYGTFATDAIAVALLLLAFSGAWIYFRSSMLRRTHPEHVIQTQQQRKQQHRAHLVRGAERHRHSAEQRRNPQR